VRRIKNIYRKLEVNSRRCEALASHGFAV